VIRAAVVGATGYTGSETVRWLLGHPEVQLASVVSTSKPGVRLDEAVPAFTGFSDLVLDPFDPAALESMDAVFFATPHGVAKDLAAKIPNAKHIFDLSSDHRHAEGWVYGLVEWEAAHLAGARRVAVPGCFATAISLAVAPFVAAEVVTGPVCVAAATGSTGSGANPQQGTHHPERFANLKAYKVLDHQHVPEIETFLEGLGARPQVLFVPLSAPVDRGILATCFVPVGSADAAAILADAYADAPLVRIRKGSPEIRVVRGSALCDLSVHQRGDTAVVLSAIDNLGKGAASQAVQCLNLSFGLPVTTGLGHIPLTP